MSYSDICWRCYFSRKCLLNCWNVNILSAIWLSCWWHTVIGHDFGLWTKFSQLRCQGGTCWRRCRGLASLRIGSLQEILFGQILNEMTSNELNATKHYFCPIRFTCSIMVKGITKFQRVWSSKSATLCRNIMIQRTWQENGECSVIQESCGFNMIQHTGGKWMLGKTWDMRKFTSRTCSNFSERQDPLLPVLVNVHFL